MHNGLNHELKCPLQLALARVDWHAINTSFINGDVSPIETKQNCCAALSAQSCCEVTTEACTDLT